MEDSYFQSPLPKVNTGIPYLVKTFTNMENKETIDIERREIAETLVNSFEDALGRRTKEQPKESKIVILSSKHLGIYITKKYRPIQMFFDFKKQNHSFGGIFIEIFFGNRCLEIITSTK